MIGAVSCFNGITLLLQRAIQIVIFFKNYTTCPNIQILPESYLTFDHPNETNSLVK